MGGGRKGGFEGRTKGAAAPGRASPMYRTTAPPSRANRGLTLAMPPANFADMKIVARAYRYWYYPLPPGARGQVARV